MSHVVANCSFEEDQEVFAVHDAEKPLSESVDAGGA